MEFLHAPYKNIAACVHQAYILMKRARTNTICSEPSGTYEHVIEYIPYPLTLTWDS